MSEFPREIKECPWCGSTERVSKKAWQEIKGKEDDTFTEIRNPEGIPLTRGTAENLSLPVVPMLVKHYDNCYQCGREYVFLFEIQHQNMQHIQGGRGSQGWPGGSRGPR